MAYSHSIYEMSPLCLRLFKAQQKDIMELEGDFKTWQYHYRNKIYLWNL